MNGEEEKECARDKEKYERTASITVNSKRFNIEITIIWVIPSFFVLMVVPLQIAPLPHRVCVCLYLERLMDLCWSF